MQKFKRYEDKFDRKMKIASKLEREQKRSQKVPTKYLVDDYSYEFFDNSKTRSNDLQAN